MGGSGKKLARSGRTLCSSRVLQTRSGNVFAPDSDFSRRFLAVLLGGSELASRLPNYGSAPGSSNMLRRPISSGSASLEGRLGKANRHDLRSPATDENSHFFERDISAYGYFQGKPSMVASAVSGSFFISIHAKWKRFNAIYISAETRSQLLILT
jgi:hypothetical protein